MVICYIFNFDNIIICNALSCHNDIWISNTYTGSNHYQHRWQLLYNLIGFSLQNKKICRANILANTQWSVSAATYHKPVRMFFYDVLVIVHLSRVVFGWLYQLPFNVWSKLSTYWGKTIAHKIFQSSNIFETAVHNLAANNHRVLFFLSTMLLKIKLLRKFTSLTKRKGNHILNLQSQTTESAKSMCTLFN